MSLHDARATGSFRHGAQARMQRIRELLLASEALQKSLWSHAEQALAHERLSVAQWLIVSDMAVHGGRTPAYFVRSLARDSGALSRAIHDLAERELLTSTRDRGDRRSTNLSLTPAGLAVFARVGPRMSALAESLGPSQAARLEQIMALINRPLDAI